MTRRRLLETCAAAIAGGSVALAGQRIEDGWLVVAHLGRTGNGNIYPEEVLRKMADTAVGKFVKSYEQPYEEGDFKALRGYVTGSAFRDGFVLVRVDWFIEHTAVPRGMYVSPCSSSVARSTQHGFDVDPASYKLLEFQVAPTSSFANATRV